VAIDGSYVYWGHTVSGSGLIGRANLDGTGPPIQGFITVGDPPQGIAIDSSQVYWTHTAAGVGRIGRANLNGCGTPTQAFIPTGASPCGLAVEPDHHYWANGGNPGSIGQAHGPFAVNQNFAPNATQDPCGVAFAAGWVYWANQAGNTIGRARLEGTGVDQSFVSTGAGNSPCGVAVDATHVYWSTSNGGIWRKRLDGTGTNESLVTGAQGPCGVAIDATASVTPAAHSFVQTTVGAQSDIQAFLFANTSSSTLTVTDVNFVGSNPGDFAKTGDGCNLRRIPAGGGCVLNLRFDPIAPGGRSATLRVTSSAANSPADIVLSGSAIAAPGGQTGGGGGAATGSGPISQAVSGGGAQALTQPVSPPPLAGGSAALPAAGLSAFRSTLTVDSRGAVVLCRATNPPTTSTAQTLVGSLPAAAAHGTKSRRAALGRGRTVIPGGRTRTVVVTLSGRARRALRLRGSLAAVSQIVAVGPGGEIATVKRHVTLRARSL
jgi:hypothetical protein